jgi:hypothetical protein
MAILLGKLSKSKIMLFPLLNLSNSSAAREWTASQTNQEGRDLLGNSAAVMLFFDQADKEGEPYQANSKII